MHYGNSPYVNFVRFMIKAIIALRFTCHYRKIKCVYFFFYITVMYVHVAAADVGVND